MVGMALRKLARENGMELSDGVAYGDFHGYAATLSEGAGYKLLEITAKFEDEARVDELLERLNQRDLMKEFRIQNLEVGKDYFSISFYDNPGTMKKFHAFVEWFMPLLPQYGVLGSDYCSGCGQRLSHDGCWKLFNRTAAHMHASCAASMVHAAQAEAEQEQLEDTGTYGGGFIGALLGAVVGAIPWAVVLYLGYMAAVLGLLIGWLAKKGYELMHGKKGPGKLVCVIIASVLGVVLGNAACDVITLAVMIGGGELPGILYSDIPALLAVMFQDAEYMRVTAGNLGMGLLFALLGSIGIFRELRAEQKSQEIHVKDLK